MEEQLLETLKHHMLTGNSLNHGHILIQSFSEESLQNASIRFTSTIDSIT